MIQTFLTRNELFTPIVMDLVPNMKYLYLKSNYSRTTLTISESFNFDGSNLIEYGNILKVDSYKIVRTRGISYYKAFYGGLLDDYSGNIICLIVRDQEFNKYAILVRENIVYNCDEEKILEKLIKFGVPSDHLIVTTNSYFIYEFQTRLKLTVKDYEESVQYKWSIKFLKQLNEPYTYRFGYNMLHNSVCAVHH